MPLNQGYLKFNAPENFWLLGCRLSCWDAGLPVESSREFDSIRSTMSTITGATSPELSERCSSITHTAVSWSRVRSSLFSSSVCSAFESLCSGIEKLKKGDDDRWSLWGGSGGQTVNIGGEKKDWFQPIKKTDDSLTFHSTIRLPGCASTSKNQPSLMAGILVAEMPGGHGFKELQKYY